MTWVFGWPLYHDYAVQYANERNLLANCDDRSESRLFCAAGNDIAARSRINDALCCWVNGELETVFGLCVDYKAKTAETAKIRFSRLPPKENAIRLVTLLDTMDDPNWYRYDDGTYNPWDGELYERHDDSDSEEGCYLSDILTKRNDSEDVEDNGGDVGSDNKDVAGELHVHAIFT